MAESQDETVVMNSQTDVDAYSKDRQNETVDTISNNSTPSAPPSDVVDLCREAFQKTAEYLRGELDGTVEDYKLLEKMNQLTMSKYSEMKHIALSISGALNDLSDKYKSLQPYLEQIDQIEESVTALEQAAYSLDQYSKRLENKFKALEKR
uniref:Biogenesis of lysosome-related organelles complex 1 subunit 2 n=1 Tax=Arion vulgaris TaxID=1028688 RepID=A0A0B7A136_9EUPU